MKHALLFLFLASAAWAAPEIVINPYAVRFPGIPGKAYWTHLYVNSGLDQDQQYKILGLPTNLSESELRQLIRLRKREQGERQRGSGGHDVIDRMLFRSIHFALGLQWDEVDAPNWKSLAEKRYSFLRNLLTTLSNLPGVSWIARDYRMDDGGYAFEGKMHEMLVIHPKTGDFYRGSESEVFRKAFGLKPKYRYLFKLDRDSLYCSYALKP